jgi:hypothetical protein
MPLMTVRRDRLTVPVLIIMLIVMTALLAVAARMTVVVAMVIAAVWTALIMWLRSWRWIRMPALWRLGIPAIAMPVHAMLITVTVMMALMLVPPLRRTPVIAIPVVAALILIPEVERYARDINVNRNICLRDHRQCQCTTKQ